jgi:hypothetical protein
MRTLAIVLSLTLLTGCTTIKKYWPRAHDPVMFDHLVSVSIAIEVVDCTKPNWTQAIEAAHRLARYAEWRHDPQLENLKGLEAHTERMNKGGSKMFCELGKKTAAQRIDAAKSAWEGR